MSSNTDDVTEELVLAAIDRAERHRARKAPDMPAVVIYEHLAIPKRSGQARKARAHLHALEAAGLLVRSRPRGIEMWALTPAGRRRLSRIMRAGGVELPESPQHLLWRNAHTLAGQEISRFRDCVGEQLERADGLLAASPPALSDAWFEVGEQLRIECRRLGSATYCLHEWVEPNDAQPDRDNPGSNTRQQILRNGRRSTYLWNP